MNPEVIAAIIAASVSTLTLIGTLAAQYFGRRATSRDTQEALEEQRKQLDRTLTEQRTRTLNERFATAAELLGSDKPAVRLAGVYAMAGLADDWDENRQTCVDVLCADLRVPYEPDPGQNAPEAQRLAFQAIREVRHTVIRVITAHLKTDAVVSWQGLNFDFTGVVIDGGDFSKCAVFRRHGLFHKRPVLRRYGLLPRRPVLRRRSLLQQRPVLWRHGLLQPCPVLRRDGRLPKRPVLRRYGLRPPSAEKIHEAIENRICGSTPIRFP